MSIDLPLNEEPLERCPNCHGAGSFYNFDIDGDTNCMTCGGCGHVLARHYYDIKSRLKEREELIRKYRANQLRNSNE